MKDAYMKLVKIGMWIALAFLVVRCFCAGQTWELSFTKAYELFGYAGEAIGFSALCIWLYDKKLWRWKYCNIYHMPVLASHYEGSLIFTWNGEMGERDTSIDIEQTFLSVKVRFKTGESSGMWLGVVSTMSRLEWMKKL